MKNRIAKIIAFVLALTLISASFAGCASKNTGNPSANTEQNSSELTGLKIGACVMDLTSEYFSESVQGYNAWIEKHPGNTLTVVDGQGKVERQVEAVENFIAAGMDCILLNALDAQALSDVVKKAVDAGIKVMQYPDADYVTVGLCNDDYNFGYIQGSEAAKWINEKLGGAATVMFVWTPENAALVQRYEGQRDALLANCDPTKLTLLEPQSGETFAEASTIAENVLISHPETRICLCVADSSACAVAEVLKAHNEDTSEWFLSGVDGTQEALNMLQDGTYGYGCSVAYSMRTPDIAYDLIDNIARAAKGQPYAEKYYQDVIAVTTANVEDYLKIDITYTDRFDQYYTYWKNKSAN
jgi:ribose transport system substrate-binding protein